MVVVGESEMLSAEPEASRMLPSEALSRSFVLPQGQRASSQMPAEDRARLLAAQQVINRQGFRIGSLALLTGYDQASELTEMTEVFRVPNTAHWFSGLANLHGNLVPVFDLAAYLGIAHGTGQKPMMLVWGRGDDAAAIVINGLPVRLELTDANRLELPSVAEALADFVSAGYEHAGEVWLEFEHRRFFDAAALQVSR